MSELSVVAIFDVGKTNKKHFFLNQHDKITVERTAGFTEPEDDVPYEIKILRGHTVQNTFIT